MTANLKLVSNSRSVFPEWMADLPMQQQSVMIIAVRGPDGVRKHHPCKAINASVSSDRFARRKIRSADHHHGRWR